MSGQAAFLLDAPTAGMAKLFLYEGYYSRPESPEDNREDDMGPEVEKREEVGTVSVVNMIEFILYCPAHSADHISAEKKLSVNSVRPRKHLVHFGAVVLEIFHAVADLPNRGGGRPGLVASAPVGIEEILIAPSRSAGYRPADRV